MHILVVDDHRIFRDGIKLLLRRLGDEVEILEAGDGQQAIALIEEQEFDLCMLDYHLPDTPGSQLLKQIKEICPELPVVMMSGAQNPAMIRSALDLEASGFIPKTMEPDDLVDALNAVLNGEIFVPPSLLDSLENDQLNLSSAEAVDYGDLIHLAQVTQQAIASSDWSIRAKESHANSPETISVFNKMLESMEAKYSELQQYAFEDALTSLPNRRVFNDRLDQEIKRIERSNKILALLVMDLDGFKQVNDTLGHQAGDELLICVSKRLLESTRKVDTVCRLGGDEFTVLIVDTDNENAVMVVVNRILTALSLPTELNGQTIQPSVSIGVAITDQAVSRETLFSRADEALYEVKNSGKNGYRVSSH